MHKSGHKRRNKKFWSSKLLIAFALLVVLPASFFIADLVNIIPQPQDNANGVQAAFAPKASPLFDVKVVVLPDYKDAVAGSKVLATISMKNLGSPGNPIDVELATSIADARGAAIYSYSKDTLAVATQLSVVREILVPSDLKAGKYFFVASVRYDGQIAEAYDSFAVTVPHIEIKVNKNTLYVLSIILLVIITFSAILLMPRRSVRGTGQKP